MDIKTQMDRTGDLVHILTASPLRSNRIELDFTVGNTDGIGYL
jgi:hypothetical protein